MAQYIYLRNNQTKVIRGTKGGLKSRIAVVNHFIVYQKESSAGVWVDCGGYGDPDNAIVTGGQCRMGVRNGNWCVDIELQLGGFVTNVEDTSWKCVHEIQTQILDADSNVYTQIAIGQQVWLLENLKTTKYNDGSAITRVTNNAAWAALTTEAYDWYGGDVNNKPIYGGLYNGYAIDSGKLAPLKCKIPTKQDFDRLIAFVGGDAVAGGRLKEIGLDHWNTPNTGAVNTYNFTHRGNGYRVNTTGAFTAIKESGFLWSQTAGATGLYAIAAARSSQAITPTTDFAKKFGMAVRCMKDTFYGTAAIFKGDSILNGLNASDDEHRWSTVWSALRGLTETNDGTNGQCLQSTVPTNPTGPVNFKDSVAAIGATLYQNNQLVLAFGTNDVGLNFTNYTVAKFKSDYIDVLTALNAKGWYGKNIVIISPYYSSQAGRDTYTFWGVTVPADEQRLADHVQACEEVATQFGCQFVDTYTHMKNNGGESLLGADGLHLNNAGHALVANYINSIVI